MSRVTRRVVLKVFGSATISALLPMPLGVLVAGVAGCEDEETRRFDAGRGKEIDHLALLALETGGAGNFWPIETGGGPDGRRAAGRCSVLADIDDHRAGRLGRLGGGLDLESLRHERLTLLGLGWGVRRMSEGLRDRYRVAGSRQSRNTGASSSTRLGVGAGFSLPSGDAGGQSRRDVDLRALQIWGRPDDGARRMQNSI